MTLGLRSILKLALLALLPALAVGCADSSKKGKSCSADTDCERGTVCGGTSCVSVTCISWNDCSSGQTCVTGSGDAATCSAEECVPNSRPCPNGEACLAEGSNRHTCVASPRCNDDVACTAYGADWTCCGGTCAASCGNSDAQGLTPDGAVTPADAAMSVPDQGGTGGTTPPPADMGTTPPGDAHICSECHADGDCAALGDGALCKSIEQGQYCTKSCQADGDCPSPFKCKAGVNLCLPPRVLCGCFATGCPNGQICDPATAACLAPKPACSPCASDDECANGLKCGTLGAAKYCLAQCPNCPAGTACTDDVCKPDSGICDACGGQCTGDTPVCVPGANGAAGSCGQCGNGHACPVAGQVCDQSNHCVDAGPNQDCIQDSDCAAPTPWCLQGACVACFEDAHCGPRRACDTQRGACVDSACGGVTCQAGSQCDLGTGRCSPGCDTDEACGDPTAVACNMETGQCYNRDGSCDDSLSVCPPGATCQSVLPGILPGNCTCLMADPTNPITSICNAGDVVSCPPGLLCSYFALPGQPPPAIGTCGADLFGFCGGGGP